MNLPMCFHRATRTSARALSVGLALALCAAASAPRASAQALRLDQVAPANTLFYAKMADAESARAAYAKTQMKAALDELKPFTERFGASLAPLWAMAGAQLQEQTGLDLDQLVHVLGGGFEVALFGIDEDMGLPRVALTLGTAGREDAVRAVVQTLEQIGGAVSTHEHQGVKVQMIGEPPIHLAELAGRLWVTLVGEDLHAIIDRTKAGATGASIAAALSQTAGYQKALAQATGGEAALYFGYVNVEMILSTFALPQLDDEERAILTQLGALDAKTVSAATTFAGGRMASRFWLGAPIEGGPRKGLLGLMQHGPADQGLAKRAPKSSIGVSIGRLDLAKLVTGITDLAGSIEPRARDEALGALGELEAQLGVTLKGDLLGPLGQDWMAASFPPPGGGLPLTVIAVTLRDKAAFVASRERMASALGGQLASIEVAGRTYRYMQGAVGELSPEAFRAMEDDPMAVVPYVFFSTFAQAWTIDGDTLLTADMPHTLADYFDLLQQEGSIVEHTDWIAISRTLPKDGQVVGVSDSRRYLPAIWNIVLRVVKAMEPAARQFGLDVDANRLPRAHLLAQHLSPATGSLVLNDEGLCLETQAVMGGANFEVLTMGAVVAVVAAIAIPNLLQARKSANEAATIGAVRTLVTAQAIFRDGDRDGDGRDNYAPSLAALEESALIDPTLASGFKSGYMFILETAPDGSTFRVQAHPVEPGKTGERYFFADESGVIRYEYWSPATEESFPIGG